MKNGITELVFILDRSGSMAGLETDTIGGFNSMLIKQRKGAGKAFVSTILFDNEVKVLHDRLPIEKVPAMTQEDYSVRGCTALLDAVGGAIKHIANIHKYARPEDVPENTMFVITTDGMENSSHRFTASEVKSLITKYKNEFGWEFLFLGANIDAVSTAADFGIAPERAVNYRCDSRGTRLNYDVISAAVTSVRQSEALSDHWKDKIEEDYNERLFD